MSCSTRVTIVLSTYKVVGQVPQQVSNPQKPNTQNKHVQFIFVIKSQQRTSLRLGPACAKHGANLYSVFSKVKEKTLCETVKQ